MLQDVKLNAEKREQQQADNKVQPNAVLKKCDWWNQLVTKEVLTTISHSNKLFILFDILNKCRAIEDKWYIERIIYTFYFVKMDQLKFVLCVVTV